MLKLNGYTVVKVPDHPHSFSWGNNGTGWVYEHRHVVETHIGRYLEPEEVVHHINLDRADNRIENLGILSSEEHSRLHAILEGTRPTKVKCSYCGSYFTLNEAEYEKRSRRSFSGKLFCSDSCRSISTRRVNRPEKETLQSEIDSMSWLALSRKYGVSDNAVRKWAKSYGLI